MRLLEQVGNGNPLAIVYRPGMSTDYPPQRSAVIQYRGFSESLLYAPQRFTNIFDIKFLRTHHLQFFHGHGQYSDALHQQVMTQCPRAQQSLSVFIIYLINVLIHRQ
jgi:hypothetical protein